MGQVRESELHLTPRPLPRQSAAAPSSRFPPLAGISILAQALRGGRPRAPLIGRATALVTLFCLNGQSLKAATAALQAELESGRGQLQLPWKPRRRLRYPWLGSPAPLGSLDSSVAEAPSFFCRA